MRSAIVIVPLLFFIMACEKPNASRPGTMQNQRIDFSIYNSGDTLTSPGEIIAFLDDSGAVEGQRVGFGGQYSKVYRAYERLKRTANDKFLRQSTYHKNPKVRVYAMWGLMENNEELAREELPRMINDKETVEYFSGCIISLQTVGDLVKREIAWNDTILQHCDEQNSFTNSID